MAFSESFGFGSSTFDNLESQIKHAIDGSDENKVKANELDIILESPKNDEQENLTRTRSRLFRNTKNETKRRKWRRSKSDSKLLDKNEDTSSTKIERYTQFFESDLAFSIEKSVKTFDNLQETEIKQISDETQLRVSQIEADFDDEIALVSAWEVPINSEDINHITQTEEAETEMSVGALKLTDDSLDFENMSLKNEQVKPTENISIRNKEEFDRELEGSLQLDSTIFICPDEDEAAKQNLKAILEASKLEIKHEAALTGIKEAAKNMQSSTHVEKECLIQTKNLTISSQKETNKSNCINKSISTKPAESLKHITAWNLPPSVLAEYEKKGIMKMFDWQVECLSNPKVLFEHCNLVYSAPTSAGKTLVSEILLLKTVLERNKKVLMILPFISVVREKMFYLQDLLTPAGYRVEGFFGGYTPPGGFDSINVAICTIEKANSIVNKLLEQNKMEYIGTVVVDEIHLISDAGRGYILELLLAKILYMSRKYGFQIQVITMSATLANVELLKRWLDAELFITNYRPVALQEMIKIGAKIYDANMRFIRDLTKPIETENMRAGVPILENDADNVAQLCLETILEGCSALVFCPSKDWCEKLAVQLSSVIHGLGKSGTDLGNRLRQKLKRDAINEVKQQLLEIPTGLDNVLEKTITFGCAFHHAGLTTEERDIVEASFKSGALKIIVATSTLSSGVNLPARRVLIRTPLFAGKQMSSLTYKQMIGRAGRTGKDTLGESILICTESNARIGRELVTAELKPINSCLEMDSSTHLKRALLEVIASGVAITKQDIDCFVNCTLLSAQKQCSIQEKDNSTESDGSFINEALDFLKEYEFVRLQVNDDTGEENYVATRLGLACLASSMPPTDGLILFSELQKSRRCFVLESELHAVYLVTPYSVCYQMQEMDWLFFLDLWEKLSPAMRKVGELVGVKESFLVRAMRGQTKLDYKLMQIHKRFYTALALQELVNETPINVVAQKYKCTRGLLQSLQQMASTFAGIVTAFCNALQWDTLSLIVSQFKERLFFGIHRDLIDLMRLPDLSHKRARALFDAGVTNLIELAQADVLLIEKVLYNSLSFDSAKQHEHENSFEAEQRNIIRNFFITGKTDLTVAEAAKLIVKEARKFVEYEVGVGKIKWTQDTLTDENQQVDLKKLHMSCEENGLKVNVNNANEKNKKRKSNDNLNETPPKLNKLDVESKGNKETFAENEIDVKKRKTTYNQKPHSKRLDKEKTVQKEKAQCDKEQIKILKENLMQEDCVGEKGHKLQCLPTIEHNVVNSKSNSKKETLDSANTHTVEQKKSGDLQKVFDSLFGDDFENKQTCEKSKTTTTIGNDNKQNQLKTLESGKEKEIVIKKKATIELEKPKKNTITSTATTKAKDFQKTVTKNIKINVLAKTNGITPKVATSRHATASTTNNDETFTINHEINNVQQNAQIYKSDKYKFKTNSTNKIKENQHQNTPKVTESSSNRTPKHQHKIKNKQEFVQQPRRSPRNHSNTFNNQKEVNKIDQDAQDLFANEESFELNSCITAALANKQSPQATEEIPSSQKEVEMPEAISPALLNGTPRHTSRLLRSYRSQRAPSPIAVKSSAQIIAKTDSPTLAIQPIENLSNASDISLELSNTPYAMQMNASHILSCTKEAPISSTFNAVEVIDICGNMELFQLAINELFKAKRFGFCLGLQQLSSQKRPLIGANLLINQQVNETNDKHETNVLFQIDDCTFLAGVAFSISENIVLYMNLQTAKTDKLITKDLKIKSLQKILAQTEITLIIYEARKQLKLLRKALRDLADIQVQLEDPKVANWLLQPDQILSLKHLAQQFAPECSALVDLCGGGRGYKSHGIDASSAITARIRCSVEACVVVHILQGQLENLERIGTGELCKFFHELEMPLQLSLCNMETIGFPANETALRELFQKMIDSTKKLETKIFSLHGKRFNLSSAQAVGRVLGLHRKPNGRVSTSRQVLEKIDEPIAQLIIAYRKLSVTMTKNIQPLLQNVQNDRIHGQSDSFTATGRISMKEPNLQNVAKDFEIDHVNEKVLICCRKAFFPKNTNRCLISADFCQLEMRILAHMSKDAQLLKTMSYENDVFTAIAAGWNKLKESEVSEQLRNGTKQICYGIIYGMGMRALAEALKCSEDEAKQVSEQFHVAYPAIRAFTRKVIDFAQRNGFVETIQGRRRYLENIKSAEMNLRNQAERQAVNSTIQGSAADIAKRAILRTEKNLHKYCSKLGLTPKDINFVLHVHDELIFEVPTTKAKKIAKVISLTMESCTKLDVPLKVKLKMGRSWGEMKEIKF